LENGRGKVEWERGEAGEESGKETGKI